MLAILQDIDGRGLLLGGIVGWLFSLLTIALLEYFRRCNFSFDVGEEALLKNSQNNEFKFLHIRVSNVMRPFWQAWFLGNLTANNARIWVSFYDYESKNVILKINGRWTSKKEPVNYETNKIDISEALLVPRETIPPGETVNVSVAIKKQDRQPFFGFNNESYLENWLKKDYELADKKYIVDIKLSAEGKTYGCQFLLQNPSNRLNNFKLTHL